MTERIDQLSSKLKLMEPLKESFEAQVSFLESRCFDISSDFQVEIERMEAHQKKQVDELKAHIQQIVKQNGERHEFTNDLSSKLNDIEIKCSIMMSSYKGGSSSRQGQQKG